LVVAASAYPLPKDVPALLHERKLIDGKATAYVCEGFMCKQPATNAEMLAEQLNDTDHK